MSSGGSWLKFKVEYSDDGIKRTLENMRYMEKTPGYTALLKSIGELYKQTTLDNFKNERDPSGTPWKHLRGSTIAEKRKGRKRDNKPAMSVYVRGRWSGDLIKSIRTRTYKDKGSMIVVGSNLKYAKHFHYGDPNMSHSWGPVPPRPFLGLNEKTNQQVRRMLVSFVLDATKS